MIRSGRLRWLPVLLVCLAGTAATASRSALLAAASGIAFALLLTLFRRSRRNATRAIVAVTTILCAAIALGPSVLGQATRNEAEAEGSAALRFAYVDLLQPMLAVTSGLGTGPGSSDLALQRVGGAYASFPLESSAMQVVVSLGVPGTLLLLLLLASILIPALQRGAILGPTLIAAYVVAASGYNLLEAFPAALTLPMAGLMITVMEGNRGELTRLLPRADDSTMLALPLRTDYEPNARPSPSRGRRQD
ncbi:O-antigen ligase family protein [Microbacterium atlanticum]|uniref:O-antigen ligase family protein n=1 Tax=Microbacterium atlanticum TaxID=2782168 RepID=UPI003B5888ED